MYTTDGLKILTESGMGWAKSNEFENVITLYDVIEDSASAEQLSHEVSSICKSYHPWNIDRDTKAYTRLASKTAGMGTLYMYVYKA